jgi:hypothetical protein
MRKRYTRKYRAWSPRWKWSARETRWLEDWELQLREAEWQDPDGDRDVRPGHGNEGGSVDEDPDEW